MTKKGRKRKRVEKNFPLTAAAATESGSESGSGQLHHAIPSTFLKNKERKDEGKMWNHHNSQGKKRKRFGTSNEIHLISGEVNDPFFLKYLPFEL